ncbi:MAG: hypothetical protein K2X81_26625 [Candidatus Obscuribacterales bacterium]|nr:hypothetical protein [Candidatus Obscuribacterales bacterium]
MTKFEQVETADTKCAPRLDLTTTELSPSLKEVNAAKGICNSNDKNGCFSEMPNHLTLINPFTGIADASSQISAGRLENLKDAKTNIKVDDLCHAWERAGKKGNGNIDDEVFRTEKKDGGMIKEAIKELEFKLPNEGHNGFDLKNHGLDHLLKPKPETEIVINAGRGSKDDIVINATPGSHDKIVINVPPGSKEKIDITSNSKTGETEVKIEPKRPVIFT